MCLGKHFSPRTAEVFRHAQEMHDYRVLGARSTNIQAFPAHFSASVTTQTNSPADFINTGTKWTQQGSVLFFT